jgi:hypothetical protein
MRGNQTAGLVVWHKEIVGLATPQNAGNASAGSIEDWATESLLAAREAYQNPGRGQRIKSGAKLGEE